MREAGAAGAQVADTMAEIRERHDAVQDLERSLLDLHQIFMDMAVLVEAQGEMMDNIENQAPPPPFFSPHPDLHTPCTWLWTELQANLCGMRSPERHVLRHP